MSIFTYLTTKLIEEHMLHKDFLRWEISSTITIKIPIGCCIHLKD